MAFKTLFMMICYLSTTQGFIHTVPEGSVGIYYRMGKLINTTSESGTHFRIPWPITSASTVQITPQTDTILDVKCGAGDGTQLVFPQVDIGNYLKLDYVYRTIRRFGESYDNYLVKDKVRAQINVICSGLTSQEIYIDKFHTLDDQLLRYLQEENDNESESGVIVQFVRMSKPKLPKQLQENYDRIANEKTARKVAEETKKRLEQEHRNQLLVAEAEAERRRKVSEKDNIILIERKKAEEEESSIQNRILVERETAKANAIFVMKEKEANGNKLLHTPEYIEVEKAKSALNNAKHYFGKIPSTFFVKDSDSEYMTSEEAIASSKLDYSE